MTDPLPPPLAGVRVIDLTRVVSGPSCTRTLCDLGAEVIKVEPPAGDLLRTGVPKRGGVAIGYAQQNAGKDHLCIDLRLPEGQALVRRLVGTADVLVENYRPGVAARLGLGWADLREAHPGLVYCSISGYGQHGPAARRRAYAPVIHAELGLLELGARDRAADPMPEPVSHIDFAVGAQAAIAICAALVQRKAGGPGRHIDVSMAETMLAVNEFSAVEANGGVGDEISPFRPGRAVLVRLADGRWVQVPGNPTTLVFAIARALGRSDELVARGWHGPADTQGREGAIRDLLQAWAGNFASLDAFEAALEPARLPLGAVKSVAEAVAEDWAVERGVLTEVDVHGAPVRLPRSPFRIAGSAIGPRRGAVRRGADNRATLARLLGCDAAELDALQAAGVLQQE